MTPRQRGFFYNGLVQTYLERDVRMEAGVEKLAEYRNFLRELALRTGQELRIGDLAKTVGVMDRTIKGWLSLAENSGLIYLLRPYYANEGLFHGHGARCLSDRVHVAGKDGRVHDRRRFLRNVRHHGNLEGLGAQRPAT